MEHSGDPCTGLMELDDIEDLIGDGERPQRVRAGPVVRARRRKAASATAPPLPEPPVCDSVVPGTQRVHVRTWGCTHNSSDSEYMAGQLAAYGYIITGELPTDREVRHVQQCLLCAVNYTQCLLSIPL